MPSLVLDGAVTTAKSNDEVRHALGATAPRRVTIDGVRLAYDDEAGPDPAVVCLHAIGHGASDFGAIRERLRGQHRVLALDWPGHGWSDADRIPASAARYADLLASWLDEVNVERAVLLGNSIGGAAAIRYAATHSARVAALVLENPGGLVALDATARAAIGLLTRFFTAGARGAAWFGPAYRTYYRLVLRQPAAGAQRTRIAAAGYEMAPTLRDAWYSFGQPDADIRALAATITCPTLFAWATQDQIVQFRRCRAAIKQFPNARLERFRAGHAAHLERPDAFADALVRFLASVPG